MPTLILSLTGAPAGESGSGIRRIEGPLSLGRGDEAGWRLADSTKALSRTHCSLELEQGRWIVRDQSQNGTFLNEEEFPIGFGQARELSTGDRLRLAEYCFSVTVEDVGWPQVAEVAPAEAPFQIPDDWWKLEAPATADPPVHAQPARPPDGPDTVRVQGTPERDSQQRQLERELLNAAVAGIRSLLVGRAEFKREFRIERTSLASERANPLKFAMTDEEAVDALLRSRHGAAAVQATIYDLAAHQVAVMAATQAAAKALLQQLDPRQLEAEDEGARLIPGAAEKRLWAAYHRRHARLVEEFEDDFDSAFGKAFVRAYEAVLGRTRQRRGPVE
jgi:predicted component of type VI protein secretion system